MVRLALSPWVLVLAQELIAERVDGVLYLWALHARDCGGRSLYDLALEAGGAGCA